MAPSSPLQGASSTRLLGQIRFLQGNLNRSRAAQELLYQIVREKSIDVAVMSEPNKKSVSKGGWHLDQRLDVGIRVYNPNIKIDEAGRGEGFAWVAMKRLTIVGCYISPNVDMHQYKSTLDDISAVLERRRGEFVVAGDFNAKSPLWGSPMEDARGTLLAEWLAEGDLLVLNEGDTPTFERGGSRSFLDITMATPTTAANIHEWRVFDEEENMSDHNHIGFSLASESTESLSMDHIKGWITKGRKWEEFTTNLSHEMTLHTYLPTPEDCDRLLKRTCDKTFRRRLGFKSTRKPCFWWNDSLTRLRKLCVAAKRRLQRARRRTPPDNIEQLQAQYKENRKDFRKAIKAAKEAAWKELCAELEDNVFGDAYLIARKKFRLRPAFEVSAEKRRELVANLFPTRAIQRWATIDREPYRPFDREDLKIAAARLRTGKAPGPDGIPVEAVKALIEADAEYVLEMLNGLLEGRRFPPDWKNGRLVLIEKAQKGPIGEQTYRPLCLLNSMAKLFEALIVARLQTNLEDRGAISERQFGFTKGRSTLGAMEAVQEVANFANSGRWGTKEYCALVTLDVKNAFGSVSWKGIIHRLKETGVEEYIVSLVQDYLSNRSIELGEGEHFSMTCGVPQGSVLGPTLWNLFYDPVLRLETELGVRLVAYADDLAVVATAKAEADLERIVNNTLGKVDSWLTENGLALAPHKSEAVLLIGRRRPGPMSFEVSGQPVRIQRQTTYLGVEFDTGRSFLPHVKKVAARATRAAMALSRLMPNVGGPSYLRRRLLGTVMDSIILYAAPIWEEVLKYKTAIEHLQRAQRRGAIRISRGYRTASTAALLVIAGTMPIALKIQERTKIYRLGGDSKELAREQAFESWQRNWDAETKGRWTHRLIQQVKPWVEREHGGITFRLTQFLSGHGCFRSYLHRIGKSDTEECWYCGEPDTPEHTVLECDRWSVLRGRMEDSIGGTLSSENIVPVMLEGERQWNAVQSFIEDIMGEKEREERRREATRAEDV